MDNLEHRLQLAERSYQRAADRADEARRERLAVVREALEAGWTHARIAEAVGHPRGWVSQVARR